METLKNSLYFPEMKLSGSKIKNFVIFTQKKAFLLFWKTETLKDSEKNFLCFGE